MGATKPYKRHARPQSFCLNHHQSESHFLHDPLGGPRRGRLKRAIPPAHHRPSLPPTATPRFSFLALVNPRLFQPLQRKGSAPAGYWPVTRSPLHSFTCSTCTEVGSWYLWKTPSRSLVSTENPWRYIYRKDGSYPPEQASRLSQFVLGTPFSATMFTLPFVCPDTIRVCVYTYPACDIDSGCWQPPPHFWGSSTILSLPRGCRYSAHPLSHWAQQQLVCFGFRR